MRRNFCLTLVLLLAVNLSWAQGVTINGTVIGSDDGNPITGVSVIEKGTTNGIITDADGKYQIDVAEGASLQFSFMGYSTQLIAVEGKTVLDITLKYDTQSLDEVVVVGYGVQKKSDITGALSSVDKEAFSSRPVADVESLLQGKASGVQITKNSGAPGAGTTVRIRGIGTVNDASPLYVVDGIFLSSMSHINPNDIASMEVLKDASATAIYGSRGANGVVLVTTKKGSSDDVKVELTFNGGVQSAWNSPNLLNSEDWLEIYNESMATANEKTGNAAYVDLVLRSPSDDTSQTTDWFDEVTRTSYTYQGNATISRGDAKSNSLLSLGYYKNNGIVIGSDYERYNARVNMNYNLSSMFRTGVNLSISSSKQNSVSSGAGDSGVLSMAQRLDPLTPSKLDDGSWAGTPYSDLHNPVAQINRDIHEDENLLFLANGYLEFEPISSLVFKSSLSLNISRSSSMDFLAKYDYGNEAVVVNSLTQQKSEYDGWLSENTVSYVYNTGEHTISAVAGFTAEASLNTWLSANKKNIPGNGTIEELLYLDSSIDNESVTASNSASEKKMYSYLGRVNYDYAGRYLLTASVRRDGSSNFGPENRFGSFPSVSAGWRLRDESFMDFVSDEILTRAKVRVGWGQVGNEKITSYQYASTLQDSDSKVEYSYVFSDGGSESEYAGLAPASLANQSAQWETVESTNFGVDLSFLNDKFTFSFDYFIKTTKDMLVEVNLPIYAGYDGSPYDNVGEVKNKGYEISMGYVGKVGEVGVGVDLNLSHAANEVVNLNGKELWGGYVTLLDNTTKTEEGESIGQFFGYVVDGVFQTDAEAQATNSEGDVIQAGAYAGDFRFKDINEDGTIDSNDRDYIGSPDPDLHFGLNINLDYKRFDLSMFFQGTLGNDIFNAFKYYNYDVNKRFAMSDNYLNHWTAENGSNEMFGLNAATSTSAFNLRQSDFYIEDGSYVRLKNLQIGYTFDGLQEWFSSARIYFAAENLFTITNYSGLDPEVISSSASEQSKSLSRGVDLGSYPQSRVISIGANITF